MNVVKDPARPGGESLEVMRRVAGRLLERVPEMAGKLLTELRATEDAYRRLPEHEHRRDLERGFQAGIEGMLLPWRERRDLAVAAETAARRAEQGVPLDALLRGYRLATQITWETMVDLLATDHPGEATALLRGAERVWQGVDRQAVVAADAYRRRENELRSRHAERTQALLDALLEGRADTAVVRAAAAALEVPQFGRYLVVATRHDGPRPARAHRPGEAAGLRLLWRARPECDLLVVSLADHDPAEALRVVEPLLADRSGVGPAVHGLLELCEARRHAMVALRTCRGPETVHLDDRLPAALAASQPDLAERLVEVVLRPLLDLDPPERETLLTTLTRWLDCDGSAARTAAALYCHRNTVFNRIRRIEALTGRSPDRPREALELALALDAYRIRGAE
ncbi:PucR family transcriptional regulator [Actinocorallia populi]|uniref:PucR family transcriptional regulator n=1 Tax=Actinocorallia populi TaxID=2079200 RepID=UPI001E4E8CB2|nr:helix-turn-helix domain-containing protein [Actinocorallia populi]